jgi:hypothetical protein
MCCCNVWNLCRSLGKGPHYSSEFTPLLCDTWRQWRRYQSMMKHHSNVITHPSVTMYGYGAGCQMQSSTGAAPKMGGPLRRPTLSPIHCNNVLQARLHINKLTPIERIDRGPAFQEPTGIQLFAGRHADSSTEQPVGFGVGRRGRGVQPHHSGSIDCCLVSSGAAIAIAIIAIICCSG